MRAPSIDYLKAARGCREPLLVATGGFGGPADHDRVGLVALAPRPRVLVDAWLETTAVPGLAEAILRERPDTREGGWDTMYATGWAHAWTSDRRGAFAVWSRAGLICTVGGGVMRTSSTRPRSRPARWAASRRPSRPSAGRSPSSEVPCAAIVAVEPYVSDDWIERGVRVRANDERVVTVARIQDRAPVLDPTDDGLNLLADTWWTHALARALAAALGGIAIVDCT